MSRLIFVNLPVADLAAPKRFNEAAGFTNNPQFSDDTAACMVLSESINSIVTVATIDAMNMATTANGGRADTNTEQDLGFMYNCSLSDSDGHISETVRMPHGRSVGQ